MKLPLILLTLVLAATGADKAAAAHPERPNILYFYVDDMGWGSIGPNGQAARKANGQPYVRTPNLDRLAAQGLNFTRGYGCTVCSPARSSQQTGFHQGHAFADRNDRDNAKKAMRTDDVTMGDTLAAAGYATGYWGKWGYGGSQDMVNPAIVNVQTLPTSHGYQHVLAELHHIRAHTYFQPTLWSAPAARGAIGGLELIPNSMAPYQKNPKYPATPALQDHAAYPETAYCDDRYAMAALDFVRRQGTKYNESGQPFFGLLAVQIPHGPFGDVSSLPKWTRAYADSPYFAKLGRQSQQWAAMVTRIDAHFGNILAALEDPDGDGDKSDSIADNTLVIFQSDNGGPPQASNVQLDANGGLRGAKGSIQEGGIRVPLVMRWPAKITADSKLKAGSNCNMVVDVTDLVPTFCELAGAGHPLGIDGVSIAPTLTGEGQQRRRDFIIHEAKNGQSIIRGRHKLVRSKTQSKGGKNKSRVKEPRIQLYDLDVDPSEKNDIADDNPDLVKELESLLLGERVTEPHGFANTYHDWTGKDGATTEDPDNWSDYKYANAGITYMADAGGPQFSWVARIVNSGKGSNTARADADLEFLGLEIRDDSVNNATQSLVLGPRVNLTGRNEIRLGQGGTLTVDNGTVSSLRCVDIFRGGMLNGTGKVNATIYNNGSVAVTGNDTRRFHVNGDYHQADDATLALSLNNDAKPTFVVKGHARLDGILTVAIAKGFKPDSGSACTVLRAKQITGTFANPRDEVVATDGSRFTIGYSDAAVTITLK